MTSGVSQGKSRAGVLDVLRTTAVIAVLLGAIASVALVFIAGRRSPQRLLLVLMSIWVLAPFIALMFANAISTRWSATTRAALYSVMIVLTLVSLAVYGAGASVPIGPHPAAVFVGVPIATWVVIAIVVPMAMIMSRKP